MFKEIKRKVVCDEADVKIVILKDQSWLLDRLVWDELLESYDDVSNGKTIIILRSSKQSGLAIGNPATIQNILNQHELELTYTNIIKTYRRNEYGKVLDVFRLKSVKKHTKGLKF